MLQELRNACLGAALLAAFAPISPVEAQTPAAPGIVAKFSPFASPGKPLPQLGLGLWRYWTYEEPFIDLTKGTPAQYSALLPDGSRMVWKDLWAAGHIDKTTLYPRSMPPGSVILGGIFRFGADVIPGAFADTYVLEWSGDADLRLARTCAAAGELNCQTQIGPNRIEVTFDTSVTAQGQWEIMRIGPTGVSNIQLYRKSNEAALKSGLILNPKFQAYARRYKVLRFMDPQQASYARPFRAGDFLSPAAASYTAEHFDAPDAPTETRHAVLFKVAVETDTAAWIHVAGLPGAPSSLDAFVGPPVNDPEPARQQWLSACKNDLAALLASPDWASYMDDIVFGLKDSAYPVRRLFYLEGWNEIWNTAQPWDRMTYCGKGVSEALGQGQDASYGYGYLTAHAMTQMDAALRRADRRQAWTMVLAQQAANIFTTRSALAGFKRYFTDRGVDPAPWVKHVGVSVQGYYALSLSRTHGFLKNTSDQAQIAALKAAIAADPAGTAKARADWIISSNAFGSLGWTAAQRAAHQLEAEAAGAYFLGDFEGESYEEPEWYMKSDPVIVNWHENFVAGPEGERVTRAWVAAMHAQNPTAIASNYLAIHPFDPEGDDPGDTKLNDPWWDGYYGETNGRTRGLDAMLRR